MFSNVSIVKDLPWSPVRQRSIGRQVVLVESKAKPDSHKHV